MVLHAEKAPMVTPISIDISIFSFFLSVKSADADWGSSQKQVQVVYVL